MGATAGSVGGSTVRRPFRRLEALAAGRGGLALMTAWGFAEATLFPVIPDVGLMLLAMVAPRRGPILLGAVVAGALAGSAVLYAASTSSPVAVTTAIVALPAIDAPMVTDAQATVASGDPMSIARVGPGTPLKVYTLAWATGPATPAALAVGVVLNRITRMVPFLVPAMLVGWLAPGFLRRHDRLVLATYWTAWAVAYALYWR